MSEQIDFAALGPKALRPLRRTEYDQLVAAGAFADERLELLRGRLVSMSRQGVAHAFIVRELHELLLLALRGKAKVLCQMPIALSDERVHRGPSAAGWSMTEEHGAAAVLRPLAFPEVEVKVSAVLPPAGSGEEWR